VLLFFVLSGFLMLALYGERLSSVRGWGQFAIRRIFRVYPLFLFVVLLSCLLFDVLSQGWALRMARDRVVAVLLLEKELELLWTVPVEMAFYAYFPLIALLLSWARSHRNRLVAISVVLGASLLIPIQLGRLSAWSFIEVFLFGLLEPCPLEHSSGRRSRMPDPADPRGHSTRRWDRDPSVAGQLHRYAAVLRHRAGARHSQPAAARPGGSELGQSSAFRRGPALAGEASGFACVVALPKTSSWARLLEPEAARYLSGSG
jgi:hypothetical protein